MRLALIGPELEENLSLRYLHAALVRAGHEAKIFDFHARRQIEAVARDVIDCEPDVVGLSMVFTARSREFVDMADQLRQGGFHGHVTAGGHFASFHARRLLEDVPALDSIVHGEGEETIVELGENLSALDRVRGLTWRDADGRIVENPRRAGLQDLDARAWPTRPARFHEYLGLPIANMLSGRGCYGNCRFCSINAWHRENPGRRFRQRDVRCVAEEMAHLALARGVRIFNFHDDNFFLPKKKDNLARLGELAQALEAAGVGRIGIQVKARPDSVDAEVLGLLKRIGLFRVFLGVETNAVAGLKTLGRGIERRQNRDALAVLKRLGIHTCFNLLLFDPETRPADVADNLRFMRRHAEFPQNFCRVEVYAGTDIHRTLADQNRLLGDYFGHTYRIADPRVQLAYEIFRRVFAERNFAAGGMNHQAMKLDYYFHVLRHFCPDRSGGGLRRQVKSLVAQLNRNSASLMERICRFVDRRDRPDERQVRRFSDELLSARAEFDAAMGPTMDSLLSRITQLARETPASRSRLLAKAASVAAAALIVGTIGCREKDDGDYHFCEMAPAPAEPGTTAPAPLRRLTADETIIVEEAVARQYQPSVAELAREHKIDFESAPATVELNDAGEAIRCEIELPEGAGGPFEEALRQQILGWKFPEIAHAGVCTVSLSLFPIDWHMCEMVPFDPTPPEQSVPNGPPPETHMHEMAPAPLGPDES
jgi:radical SAM superfamily enzyme YgiQ (UPF0313 family)